MESTEIPLPQFKNNQISNFKENSHFNLISSHYAIQPSMSMPLNDFQKRIPYERITHRAKIKNKKRPFNNLLTLITLTYTKMTTEMVVTIQTRTVTISGCTPTPFPYNVCVWNCDDINSPRYLKFYSVLYFKLHDAFLFVYNMKYLTEIPYSPKLKHFIEKRKTKRVTIPVGPNALRNHNILRATDCSGTAFTRKEMTNQQTGNNKID